MADGVRRHYTASERALAASSHTRSSLLRFLLLVMGTAVAGTTARALWRRVLRWILGCVGEDEVTSSLSLRASARAKVDREASLGMLGKRQRVSSVILAQLSYPLLTDVISEEPTGGEQAGAGDDNETPSTPRGDSDGTSSPPRSPCGAKEGHFAAGADVRIMTEVVLPLRESPLRRHSFVTHASEIPCGARRHTRCLSGLLRL